MNKQVHVLLLFVGDRVSSEVEVCQCHSSIFGIKYSMILVVLINNKIHSACLSVYHEVDLSLFFSMVFI